MCGGSIHVVNLMVNLLRASNILGTLYMWVERGQRQDLAQGSLAIMAQPSGSGCAAGSKALSPVNALGQAVP